MGKDMITVVFAEKFRCFFKIYLQNITTFLFGLVIGFFCIVIFGRKNIVKHL